MPGPAGPGTSEGTPESPEVPVTGSGRTGATPRINERSCRRCWCATSGLINRDRRLLAANQHADHSAGADASTAAAGTKAGCRRFRSSALTCLQVDLPSSEPARPSCRSAHHGGGADGVFSGSGETSASPGGGDQAAHLGRCPIRCNNDRDPPRPGARPAFVCAVC